jgi:hypothetical protein
MSYKQYLNELQDKIAAYEYFNEDNLKHLQGGLELVSVQRELFERALPFKGTDKYAELTVLVDKLTKASQSYDTMYTRYMQYKQGFEEVRKYASNVAKVLRKYEQEEDLLAREL